MRADKYAAQLREEVIHVQQCLAQLVDATDEPRLKDAQYHLGFVRRALEVYAGDAL
jgi:hypothetical protein